MDSGRLEALPPGTGHLDTVRALHQTVVSLRTALEISKNELKVLKEKYEQHSRCIEYADVIEKLSLENHVLRRKIIDSGYEDSKTSNIKLEVTYSPRQKVDDLTSEVIIKSATTDVSSIVAPEYIPELSEDNFCSTENLDQLQEEDDKSASQRLDVTAGISPIDDNPQVEESNSEVIAFSNIDESHPTFKTKLELLSKFDVRIKVRALTEGTIVSSTTSESDSTDKAFEKESVDSNTSFQFEEKRQHFENIEDSKGTKIKVKSVSSENIKMAVPNEADVKSKTDKFDVQVRITSEENLVIKEGVGRNRRKDTMNLDVDDLSLRSLSEGDNSVFSEGVATPVDPRGADDKERDNSGNESEEVDDIELIFTTDESKDMSNLQEDLVSIQEGEPWVPPSASTHSTPVLIKFHTLDPDFQPGGDNDNVENENQENTSLQSVIADLKTKRVSLPNDKEIHRVLSSKGSLDLPSRGILKSCYNKSDNTLYKRSPNTSTKRLDSVDSLTCEYNRGLSFDNTKSSSFELGSSMDMLQREDSMDSFRMAGNFGHRFSVFAETDISKCGISEDDLAATLNARRNTCPNPFQYRAPPRSAGPLKASGRRPVLRAPAAARRESGAQTDVCALPPRWGSDGYLAYKMSIPPTSAAPTLPARGAAPPPGRRPPAPRAPPARRSDETRRVLLSDIGFTSMVPELSRSADPLWAGRLAAHAERAERAEPGAGGTARYMSRGSAFRSPCLSIDRSRDWTPQTVYIPGTKEHRPWRSSLPDVRRDDTDELLQEAECYLRRSIDNLRSTSLDFGGSVAPSGQPYIPVEPRQLRLGHTVKLIAPHGRVTVGRVRYVGIAGGSAANSSVFVGAELPTEQQPTMPRNDGTHRGRRYFLAAPHCTALFVPFAKVVMAWAN